MTVIRIKSAIGTLAVEGPKILFWPSLFLDRKIFDPQIAYFAKSHQVIAVDGPRHGESGKSGAPR